MSLEHENNALNENHVTTLKQELNTLRESQEALRHELVAIRKHQSGMETRLKALQLESSVSGKQRSKSVNIIGEERQASWLVTAALIVAIPLITWFCWHAWNTLQEMQKKLERSQTSGQISTNQ